MGPAKQAIISFVKQVTDKSGGNYVEPEDRIATFDQDGTLWVEHPLYTQAMFALARVHELAPQHPEWKQREPFKAVLADDREAMAKFSRIGLGSYPCCHPRRDDHRRIPEHRAGMDRVGEGSQVHRQAYTEMVYVPMLELLDFLRGHGFKTYIVSGGGQEFMRVYSRGSTASRPSRLSDQYHDQVRVSRRQTGLVREPEIFFIDDWGGKAGPSTSSSAAALRRLGNSTAISRCWSGPKRATAHG